MAELFAMELRFEHPLNVCRFAISTTAKSTYLIGSPIGSTCECMNDTNDRIIYPGVDLSPY